MKALLNYFALTKHQTTWQKEVIAGFTSFFATSYILIVNSLIITDSGIPLTAAIMATAIASFLGCLLMAFWANAPLILVPGMGVNAFFTYIIVHEMGLKWNEALAVVIMSGILFTIAAFTPISRWLADAIPQSLKQGMTVGIGLLITFIGLQKGGLVIPHEQTLVTIALNSSKSWLTLFGFILAVVLFVRKIRGSFLISMVITTLIAWLTGFKPEMNQPMSISLEPTWQVLQQITVSDWGNLTFWSASFTLTLILVFENMGIIQGLLPNPTSFPRAYQASAISTISSGFLGTSPTICALESATGIADGGKTGLTSLTTGILFLLTIPLIPIFTWIPDSAIASILMVVGSLMIREIENISFKSLTDSIPAFVTFTMIPFTYNIPDGIAFGFLAYAILQLTTGNRKKLSWPFYFLTTIFILQFIFHP